MEISSAHLYASHIAELSEGNMYISTYMRYMALKEEIRFLNNWHVPRLEIQVAEPAEDHLNIGIA